MVSYSVFFFEALIINRIFKGFFVGMGEFVSIEVVYISEGFFIYFISMIFFDRFIGFFDRLGYGYSCGVGIVIGVGVRGGCSDC